jgi:transcriptional regulator with XRE-family HTH domain
MTTAIATHFGKLLRELRQRAGWSQSELALYLNIDSETISRIETGSQNPPRNFAFYEQLLTVPGFSKADITLLLDASEGDESAGVVRKRLADVAEEPSAEYLPDIDDDGIISPPMPHEVVDDGDHLTEHISDLQSQAKLGSETKQRPSHYQHENVVFHVTQLQAEALGKQGTKKGSTQSYEVVATLQQAAQKTGVPPEEIMTLRDIQAEWDVDRTHLQDWSRRGKQGQPHLPPLPVRLKGPGGGQLLFLREEVERKITYPPKPGRPPK